MYSKTRIFIKYLLYLLSSSNGKGHGTHSPFIFEFITRVLNDKNNYDAFAGVEALRRRMLKDTRVLEVEDLGAGSFETREKQRSVASIARNAAKPKKYGQLLYRMVRHYQPQTVIELGTSLGISTSYLALANPAANLITFEGARAVAQAAKQNFANLQLRNISLVEGNFDDTLLTVLEGLSSVDLAFIDGNHRREPTVRYFHSLLTKTGNDSILVFDDIHWSPEMEKAWETVKAHPSVRCTVDLFFIGIVFFRSEFREKQHFSIRF